MSGYQMCRALFEYVPVEVGDLALNEGDIVWFLSQDPEDPDWWYGDCNGVQVSVVVCDVVVARFILLDLFCSRLYNSLCCKRPPTR